MQKKVSIFVLIICLLFTSVPSVFALYDETFDYSVFENYEPNKFEIKKDPMYDDGVVIIKFPSDLNPFPSMTDDFTDTDYRLVSDIICDPTGFPPVIRMTFYIVNETYRPFTIRFRPDKKRYILYTNWTSDTAGRTQIEGFTLVFTPDLMEMLEEIVEKNITAVPYRMETAVKNERPVNGEVIIDLNALKTLLELYKEAGGMDQDFSNFEGSTRYKVMIEE